MSETSFDVSVWVMIKLKSRASTDNVLEANTRKRLTSSKIDYILPGFIYGCPWNMYSISLIFLDLREWTTACPELKFSAVAFPHIRIFFLEIGHFINLTISQNNSFSLCLCEIYEEHVEYINRLVSIATLLHLIRYRFWPSGDLSCILTGHIHQSLSETHL